MSEEKKNALQNDTAAEEQQDKTELSPTWAQECIEDIDDWIESQGIYLRQ